MTQSKLTKKANEVRNLDEATQELIASIHKKDGRFRTFFIISWTILLILGIFGIYKQNQIAGANKTHIDCVVKFFTTPQPSGTTHKVIVDPNGVCDIKGLN